eukprot:TRINITY_DN2058_c0_g1_i1.p1 TRINITY_DN2058_c0_g1~~TRINITY_DN2058_c0_g1_i1.p1  ORF type:complete len:397 (+),score=103.79 TRINITY_DN2058_c0_g1_i1:725-1915(+)
MDDLQVTISTASIDLRIQTLRFVRTLIKHHPDAINKHLHEILSALAGLVTVTSFYHPDVRVNAYETIQVIAERLQQKDADDNADDLAVIADELMEGGLNGLSQSLLAGALSAVMEVIKAQPALLDAADKRASSLLDTVIKALRKDLPCSFDFSDDDEATEDKSEQQKKLELPFGKPDVPGASYPVDDMVSACCDAAENMAGIFGPIFDTRLGEIIDALLVYCRPGREDRSDALGTIAMIASHRPVSVLDPYIPKLLPLLAECLQCGEEPSLQRNAAFAAGVLCEKCPQTTQYARVQMTQAVSPLLEHEDGAVRDNAVSSIFRAIGAALSDGHTSDLPLQSLLPALVQRLPLEDDVVEAANVVEQLKRLLDAPEWSQLLQPWHENISEQFRKAAQAE